MFSLYIMSKSEGKQSIYEMNGDLLKWRSITNLRDELIFLADISKIVVFKVNDFFNPNFGSTDTSKT